MVYYTILHHKIRLMLKLKLQYFGHLMQRADSLEKTLMPRKIEGRRRRGWQDEMVGWHHRLNGREFEQAPGDGEGQGGLACCHPWGQRVRHDLEKQANKRGQKACMFTGRVHMVLPYLLLLPSVFPSIRVFSNESAVCIRWPKYWSFNFSPSNEYSVLISFRIDCFDLLAVQETLKSLLQYHSSNASILWHSAFFMAQLSTSIHDYWKNHSFD